MIIIMAVVMVAMIAFGGTYAYFTATATGVTTKAAKTANVELISNGAQTGIETSVVTNILPGQKAFKANQTVELSHKSTVDTYVFATISTDSDLVVDVEGSAQPVFQLDVTTAEGGWTKLEDGVYYLKVAAATGTTEATEIATDFTFNVVFNSAVVSNKDQETAKETSNVYKSGDSSKTPVAIMDQEVVVELTFAAIQQKGANDQVIAPETAWEAIEALNA